jgi:hypothetical protein
MQWACAICHLWPARLSNIFPLFLTTDMIFEKNIESKMCLVLLQFFSETFLILRKIARDIIKIYICLLMKYPLFLSSFSKTLIFSTDFERYWNIKFHGNPSSGSRVVPRRRTAGGYDEAISRFWQFCKFAWNSIYSDLEIPYISSDCSIGWYLFNNSNFSFRYISWPRISLIKQQIKYHNELE